MPTEAEMRNHDGGNNNNARPAADSVVSIPRSFRGPGGPQYAPQYDMRSVRSTSTTGRPTLNMYVAFNGDIVYEPDPKWSRAFGRAGYKINVHAVPNLYNIHQDGVFYSQYAHQAHGSLRVNGEKVPLFYTENGPVYSDPGYEHARIYAPRDVPPGAEIRQIKGLSQKEKGNGQNQMSGFGKVACLIGLSVCCLGACILPCVCH